MLTKRQVQVLKMAADGLLNKQIAIELGISPQTVKNHLYAVYQHLGAINRAHAVFLACRMGIIDKKLFSNISKLFKIKNLFPFRRGRGT